LAIVWLSLVFAASAAEGQWPPDVSLPNLPFPMSPVAEVQIPQRRFVITDFGAVGDGQTKNTEAFTRAVEACSKAGGGRVVIPAGL